MKNRISEIVTRFESKLGFWGMFALVAAISLAAAFTLLMFCGLGSLLQAVGALMVVFGITAAAHQQSQINRNRKGGNWPLRDLVNPWSFFWFFTGGCALLALGTMLASPLRAMTALFINTCYVAGGVILLWALWLLRKEVRKMLDFLLTEILYPLLFIAAVIAALMFIITHFVPVALAGILYLLWLCYQKLSRIEKLLEEQQKIPPPTIYIDIEINAEP